MFPRLESRRIWNGDDKDDAMKCYVTYRMLMLWLWLTLFVYILLDYEWVWTISWQLKFMDFKIRVYEWFST